MCGIFGMATTSPSLDKQTLLLRLLTHLNQSRGLDSAGFAIKRYDDGRPVLYKRCLAPNSAALSARFRLASRKSRAVSFIGHTRAASLGEVTNANAHPHRAGGTYMVHNGTAINLKELQKATGKDYDSDSKHLAYLLEKQNNVKPAIGGLNLAYFREGEKTLLHLLKCDRPLAIGFNDTNLIFSSDTKHMEASFYALGEKFERFAIKDLDKIRVVNRGGKIRLVQTIAKWPKEMLSPAETRRLERIESGQLCWQDEAFDYSDKWKPQKNNWANYYSTRNLPRYDNRTFQRGSDK